MRKPHLLNATKESNTPNRMIFFDSESHVDMTISESDISRSLAGQTVFKPHDPYLVCATFYHRQTIRKKEREFYESIDYSSYTDDTFLKTFWSDVDDFARWGERTYLFAHNAKYDTLVTGCVPYLVSLGYTVTKFSDSNPFILGLRQSRETGRLLENGEREVRHKTLILLSSTNYYATSLAALGKTFGIEKLDYDHSLDTFEIKKAIYYCRRDVEILVKAMMTFFDFIKNERLGNFSLTLAGQAFASFRHRFMSDNIYIHSDPRALETERNAYAGGRNECFRLGAIPETVYVYDVNSMYPSVMAEGMYPTRLMTYRGRMEVDELAELLASGLLCCADCFLDTDTPLYHKKSERLIFPVGAFWTTLSTPEIQEALKRGHLIKVRHISVYESGRIFAPYVAYFYAARLTAKAAGDAVYDLLYKNFLNSLYGKFGQKSISWERIDDAPKTKTSQETIYNPVLQTHTLIKIFGGSVWERNDDPEDIEAYHSFPAVAAHVTAYARMRLWQYMEAAGLENVFYTDTDSLFVSAAGSDRLQAAGHVDKTKLGALKLEKRITVKLFGCKDYQYTDVDTGDKVTKIKGVSKNALSLPDSSEGMQQYITTMWGGFTDGLRAGDLGTFRNRLVVKTLSRTYKKGFVHKDGRIDAYVLDGEFVINQNAAKPKAVKEVEYNLFSQQEESRIRQQFVAEFVKTIREQGYIKIPSLGEYRFWDYQELDNTIKRRYFRKAGLAIDEMAATLKMSIAALWEKL